VLQSGPGTLEQINVAWLNTPCNFFATISSWYDITVPVIHWRPVHNLMPCRGTHVQTVALAGSALARSVRVQEVSPPRSTSRRQPSKRHKWRPTRRKAGEGLTVGSHIGGARLRSTVGSDWRALRWRTVVWRPARARHDGRQKSKTHTATVSEPKLGSIPRSSPHCRTRTQGFEMLDQVLDATLLYPLVIGLLLGSAQLGAWIGRRFHCADSSPKCNSAA
jgi:hypothetical protein